MKFHSRLLTLLLPGALCGACVTTNPQPASDYHREVSAGLEEIHVVRTVRIEHARGATEKCAAAPFPVVTEDVFETWSIETQPNDGRIIDTRRQPVGSFRGCIGQMAEGRALQMFVVGTMNDVPYTSLVECRAPPAPGPLRTLLALTCVGSLTDLPPAYAGGLMVSSTLAPVLGRDQPVDAHVPGYLSTSVITTRLWKKSDSSAAPGSRAGSP